MLDDELDPLIDDVAKAMTEAPPDAQLAHRVSMRLAGERDASRAVWARPWVLVPMASACVVLARRLRRAGEASFNEAGRRHRAASVEQAGCGAALPGAAKAGLTARPTKPMMVLELPPPAIAPIEVDRLEVQSLVEMSAIELSPIAIDRIEITAMP